MPKIPFAFQWSIAENEILPLKDSVNGCLYSDPVSNIPEFEYYLAFCPNGNNDENRGQTYVFLHVDLKNVKKVEADFTVTIKAANYSNAEHFVFEKSTGWGPMICQKEELFESEKKYISDGKFIVKVNGIFKFEKDGGDVGFEEQQKWDGGELGDEAWQSDETKDFTIVVDGKEIKVHKCILGIRSDVFMTMLKSNMKEAEENKMVITDFSFTVVEAAIKLIYHCTFTSTLSLEELMSLLQFFDKYNLSMLKTKVERFLIDQISAATVVRLTNHSSLTNSFKLKEKCMEFLSTAIASKTPLAEIDILDKDILLETVKNSFYYTVETEK